MDLCLISHKRLDGARLDEVSVLMVLGKSTEAFVDLPESRFRFIFWAANLCRRHQSNITIHWNNITRHKTVNVKTSPLGTPSSVAKTRSRFLDVGKAQKIPPTETPPALLHLLLSTLHVSP